MNVYTVSPEHVFALQYFCRAFAQIFRPYVYRHVHLRSEHSATQFLATIVEGEFSSEHALAASVHTLQVGFSLDGMESETEPFWVAWRLALPKLTRLTVLNICYEHGDVHFLERFIDLGNMRKSLPASTHCLHLKPVPDEQMFKASQLS